MKIFNNVPIILYIVVVMVVSTRAIDQDYSDNKSVLYETVTEYGYNVECHDVETQDEYLLTMFRILNEKRYSQQVNRTPVLIMHGLLGSSENFILVKNNSLPFALDNAGYDVWLGNARGNVHSRKHKRFNPDEDKQFWDFSIHEIGVYDIPAMIDYILNITGQSQLFYIGHSQGTTTYFIMASERPEYNEKIKLMIAMAPSAILKHMRHPLLKMLMPHYRLLQRLFNTLNIHELMPMILNRTLREITRILCYEMPTFSGTCQVVFRQIAQLISGYDNEQLETSSLSLGIITSPGGASTKQAVHYAQLVETGEFQQYDYGPKENMKKYNSQVPPKYNFQNLTAPIALFYAQNDIIINSEDVISLSKELPNLAELYLIPYKKFTHGDFLYAKDIMNLLYNHIIYSMNEYNTKS